MAPILGLSSAELILTQILVIAKLNESKDLISRGFVCHLSLQETTCSKLATEAQEYCVKTVPDIE